jgi:hypothetical protein
MIYGGPGFLALHDLAPRSSPPPLSSVNTRNTYRKTEKKRQYAQGRGAKGVGEEPNHMTTGKPCPLYTIQYSQGQEKNAHQYL